MKWIRRIRFLLHRSDFAEEMRIHQQIRAEAGEDPRSFGNDLLLRERARDAWGWLWLDGTMQDIRIALRQMRHAPAMTALAIAILALGIGANTAMFSVLDATLLHPLPFPHPQQLVAGFWKAGVPALARKGAYEPGQANLAAAGTRPQRVSAAEVSANFFSIMGVAVRGRSFLPSEQSPGRDHEAVVSAELARELGGDVLGRRIKVNGLAITVVGVAPPGFAFPRHVRLWMPMVKPWSFAGEKLSESVILVFQLGRLRPGATVAEARREAIAIAARPPGSLQQAQGYIDVEPLRVFTLSTAGSGTSAMLWMLLGAVGLVLLIACADVANLQLARAVARQKEIALRAALGASRARLLRQNLTESLVLATCGGGAGVLLAWTVMPALRQLVPAQLPRFAPVALDGRVLAYSLVVTLLSGCLFGLLPSLHAWSLNLRRASEHPWLPRTRSTLAAAEIALALMLVAGAGLLLISFSRLISVNPGFAPEHLLTAELDLGLNYKTGAQENAFYQKVIARLHALPSVSTAAIGSSLPMAAGGRLEKLLLATREPTQAAAAQRAALFSVITPEYFQALGVPLLRGRYFTGGDQRQAEPVAIINATLARNLWPDQSALGKQIALPGNSGEKPHWRTIVGVAGNVPLGLGFQPQPFLYVPMAQAAMPSAFLLLRTSGEIGGLADAVRRAVHSVDPEEPVSHFASATALIARSANAPRFRTTLLGLFATLALALASAGILGVMANWAERRRAEIGIRMALGAQPQTVVRMVLREGMRLVAIGIAVGLVGALALGRLLQHFLFHVGAHDPLMLAAAAALMALIGAAACSLPAWRAARVDPLATLRSE